MSGRGRLIKKFQVLSGSPGQVGFALLVVVWGVTLLSLLLVLLLQEGRLEARLQADFLRKRHCRQLAATGLQYALGKLVLLKQVEAEPEAVWGDGLTPWRPDGSPNLLALGDDQVEVRIYDEGGKINLNRAGVVVLSNLFAALGYNTTEARQRAQAILSWRGADFLPPPLRPDYGYYQQQLPPYILKNRPFDTVEELRWVRGCGEMAPRLLTEIFTVMELDQGINLNAAARPVLQALGLPATAAVALERLRTRQWLQDLETVAGYLGLEPTFQFLLPVTMRSSTIFTVLATGGSGEVRHTIKAVVRLRLQQPDPWTFLYWHDDYPF